MSTVHQYKATNSVTGKGSDITKFRLDGSTKGEGAIIPRGDHLGETSDLGRLGDDLGGWEDDLVGGGRGGSGNRRRPGDDRRRERGRQSGAAGPGGGAAGGGATGVKVFSIFSAATSTGEENHDKW